MLAKQLREAVSFGQAQESRANALERHLKSSGAVDVGGGLGGSAGSGLQLPGSGTLPAASFNSGPLYLSAALPPRLVASPGRMETEACPQCGTLNKPGSKFCIKCGVTLRGCGVAFGCTAEARTAGLGLQPVGVHGQPDGLLRARLVLLGGGPPARQWCGAPHPHEPHDDAPAGRHGAGLRGRLRPLARLAPLSARPHHAAPDAHAAPSDPAAALRMRGRRWGLRPNSSCVP